MSDKKVYSVIEPNCHTLIQSNTPSGAAKKVYSKCVRPYLNKNQENSHHTIKIQNENGKLFEYDVHAVEKNDYVDRGGKKVHYKYNVIVRSKNIHKSKQYSSRKSSSRSRSSHRSYSPCKRPFVWIKRFRREDGSLVQGHCRSPYHSRSRSRSRSK